MAPFSIPGAKPLRQLRPASVASAVKLPARRGILRPRCVQPRAPAMHHSVILFDLDGTLTDPREGITRSVQYALAKLGIDEPDLTALEHFIGPPLLQCFMATYALDEATGWQAVNHYRERFRV